MEFKTATGKETLEKDGFQVFKVSNPLLGYLQNMSKDLDYVARNSHHSDVFRTKLGDIKQIQNLDFGVINQYLTELVGGNDYERLNNQYFCKPPNYKMTSAHQDNAYFNSEERVLTFWIPLQDVDLLNSCMFYVPGSHKKRLVEHKPIGTNVRTRTGATGVSLYSDVYKNSEFVKVPMKAYNVLVHDSNTMHFSSANQTDEYRLAITAILKIK